MDERLVQLLHHRSHGLNRGDPISPPIHQTSAFYLPDDPKDGDYSYTREANPTWTAVEAQISILEAAPAIVFPSGMAAIAAILYTQLRPGDRLIMPSDGYYGVRAFAEQALRPIDIEVTYVPTPEFGNTHFDGARLVWIETPSNPGLDVCDIADVVARAKAAGAMVAADNTTLTPLLQQPLDMGVDAVAVSDTKAMSGHGDLLFGHAASRDKDIMAQVETWRRYAGAIPGPAEAALVYRGIETLEVRLQRMCANAMDIAHQLKNHIAVKSVRYPGLVDDPSHTLMKTQATAFGFIIGFTLASKAAAEAFIAASEVTCSATSFGSVHSSAERRARWGEDVAEGFIRLSVGCEPAGQLWDGIEAALKAV